MSRMTTEQRERANGPSEWVIFDEGSLPSDATVTIEALPRVERQLSVRCHSGTPIEGTWVGVRLADCLEAANVPPEVTHVLVESGEYRACLAIVDVLEALIALEEHRSDGSDEDPTPRLVDENIDVARWVKRISQISAVSLSPGIDPTDLEHLPN